MGGGLGDVAEVLDAGRILARAGYPPVLYRPNDRPLPPSVDGPWDLTEIDRRTKLAPVAPRALTVAPNWGVSAAPERSGPLGRAGPWAPEAAEVERRYGPESTLHVSLEEFARTLTSVQENGERWREGGTSRRELARRRASVAFRTDARTFQKAFRVFRGFDRRNVLHLYQTFRPDAGFGREFPEAVQVGPLWPVPNSGPERAPRRRTPSWVWYASPASSDRLVASIDEGLRGSPIRGILVRSHRPIELPDRSPVEWSAVGPMPARVWSERFRSSALRIVTGSRTLLEALALGEPFLYYNGTMADGRRRRRHRPEKIQALLAAWRAAGLSSTHIRDLDDFSRGRRVVEVVQGAATDPAWSRRFPRGVSSFGFPAGREDGGRFLVDVATTFARGAESSSELVGRIRATRSGSAGRQV